LEGENNCNSGFNYNKCAYVRGTCAENPCSESDCEGIITAGCKLSNENACVVDECMRYDEEGCKTEGLTTCVVLAHGNEERCISDECSSLGSHSDCNKNDYRCKIVQDVCVENPCDNEECNSPACTKVEGQCVYDTCAQYTSSGMCVYTYMIFLFMYSFHCFVFFYFILTPI
jgi:hypothetical protein